MGGPMRSVPPCGKRVGSGMKLGLIEHECNGPTRYRVVVLTSWDRADRNSDGQTASAPSFAPLKNARCLETQEARK